MQPHVDVESSVQLRLVVADADAVPLPVSLRYSASDPYAVRAVFSGDGMEVEWVFARELLRTGLASPVGDGDVHVWPSWGTGRELLMISLTSPDGQAVLEATADDVRSFLDRTAAVVPDGDESAYLDLDAALTRLLS
ncbi:MULTISPECIES: SsgA family sporulation/cell division regulator [unclassified Kineosporia]|jgi:Streptomyces sporulation and cell division protein, SsgA|uniref:SsgA family sporulation/cell division regulator n=1 Tax=unclassified Kineosporia TaxID=2626061 RepID=UPI000B4BD5FF|nr:MULTISPECIES: SsgA family sporulation/cell division regulator [unclassified Kineosporia]